MVAGLARLAAGSPAHVRFLRLMTARAAFREGIRRVNAAPMVLAGMFAVTLFVALPLVVRAARHDCGAPWDQPRRRDRRRRGPTTTGGRSFRRRQPVWARRSFRRSPASAPCSTISAACSINAPLATTIVGATAAWLVLWSFLAGGIIDRFARARRTRAHGFFGACGMHFWRLLRLGDRRLAGIRVPVPLRAQLDLRRRLSVADKGRHGRAHGVCDPARGGTWYSARS